MRTPALLPHIEPKFQNCGTWCIFSLISETLDISLHKLLPVPLRDELRDTRSDIWNKDISFARGEIIHIQAPSGTGKTTLIHFLYRLRADYEGQIRLGDQDLRGIGTDAMAKLRQRQLSIVFQDLKLFKDLTGTENLEIKRGLTDHVPTVLIPDYARRLGIAEKLENPGHTLSYGEQQRLAIIRSLLQPFGWILLDEPFSHLDHQNISRAVALIGEVTQANGAGLLIADLEDDDHFDYTRKLKL